MTFLLPILLAADEPQHLPMWPLMVLLGLMFYMFILGPDRRTRREQADMLANLKKNDQVVTIGGIKGTVTNIKEEEVTIRIDDANNTRLRVLRSAISRIDLGEKSEKDKDK